MNGIIKGEGLLEYIRRTEKEISEMSGIPKKYFGSDQRKMEIIGNAEFIEKFLDALPYEYKIT